MHDRSAFQYRFIRDQQRAAGSWHRSEHLQKGIGYLLYESTMLDNGSFGLHFL